MSEILRNLGSTADLRSLSLAELEGLAEEVREEIIRTVSRTGGHLASSLGVVELTIALHRVLDTPRDKIVWDVGHQAYCHKLLTGRLERFGTLRQLGGISGFPKREESPFDAFDVGHSSTSISAALGMAAARDQVGGIEKVVAVIGDGSLTSGLAFEGLNQAGHLKKNLLVILNDNEMSISANVGALSSFLSRKMTGDLFQRLRRETEVILGNVPRIGRDLLTIARRAEDSIKSFLTPGMLFEAFGFNYVGPINGHRLDELLETLQNVTRLRGPTLVHVVTRKGKGFLPAERQPALFHGVGPFDPVSGHIHTTDQGAQSFTAVFGQALVKAAESDSRVVAITAAMQEGTGLRPFAERFPERFYDVGIAEQHAVTFAAGLACRGLRPVVAIYSTFLQRAYDNILHDVCLQKLPVTFALDRGGLVGADGPTHHGTFDLSYLRHIPNLTLAAPRDGVELQRMLSCALQQEAPFAFRYPRGPAPQLPSSLQGGAPPGCGELLREGSDGVIMAVGSSISAALEAAELLEKQGYHLAVLDPRWLKPLDEALLLDIARYCGRVITLEENALAGGFGSAVLELLNEQRLAIPVLRLGIPDTFVEQGTPDELRARLGIDTPGLVRRISLFLQEGAGVGAPRALRRSSLAAAQ